MYNPDYSKDVSYIMWKRIMDKAKEQGEIKDFIIQCDEELNTSEVIARNEMHFKITLPVYEYEINLILDKDGKITDHMEN